MRIALFAVTLCSLLLSQPAFAADPAKGMTRHALGSNLSIDLPKKWKLVSYPMPMAGATNYRIDTGSMRAALTGFDTAAFAKPGEPPKALAMDEVEVKDLVVKSSVMYVAASAEKTANPVVVPGAGVMLGYTTYSSPDGKAVFHAMAGRMYECVTVAVARTPTSEFAITIGSDDCGGKDHKAVIAALSALQPAG